MSARNWLKIEEGQFKVFTEISVILPAKEIRRAVGKFELRQIANVDQTPLPFSFANGETYAETGDKTVWVKGGVSGLDKRQCTVQITLFADSKT